MTKDQALRKIERKRDSAVRLLANIQFNLRYSATFFQRQYALIDDAARKSGLVGAVVKPIGERSSVDEARLEDLDALLAAFKECEDTEMKSAASEAQEGEESEEEEEEEEEVSFVR